MERSANASRVTRLGESCRYDAKTHLIKIFARLYPARLGRHAEVPGETRPEEDDRAET